jgi:hypothetical protein
MQLEEIRQGTLVARGLPVDTLLIGIAPAGVDPDLGVDPDELTVKCLGEKLQVGVGAVGPGRASVMRWFFDLNQIGYICTFQSMLARAGAQMVPNFTGRSVRRWATFQSAVNSSAPRVRRSVTTAG